jgi:SAM-dependent methyltransferase
MNVTGRYQGALDYIAVHWPTYLFFYGGGTLWLLLLIVVSAQVGWLAFVPLGFALLLVWAYFFAASLWAAHKLHDWDQQPDYDVLFEMSGLRPQDTFVHPNLGRRDTAVRLARHLTSGRIIVVDLYHPQLTPSRSLARRRSQNSKAPRPDPRLRWRDGRLELLPVPDSSVKVVIMCQMAVEFWQHGDRLCLLQEIYRVLAPGGRLLMSERVRSRTNSLVMGPAAVQLPAAAYWRELLETAGFTLVKERDLHDLVRCFRADKPLPERARQLLLDF